MSSPILSRNIVLGFAFGALLLGGFFVFSQQASAEGKICIKGVCIDSLIESLPVHDNFGFSLKYFKPAPICSGDERSIYGPYCNNASDLKEGLGSTSGSEYSKGYCQKEYKNPDFGTTCATKYEAKVTNTTGPLCIKGRCYDPFVTPTINLTINDQKGVVWISKESDITIRWNLQNAERIYLSCSGDCPSNLYDINSKISHAYTKQGSVAVNWNTAESIWTLEAYRGVRTARETITVIPLENRYGAWYEVVPAKGMKFDRPDGYTEYAVEFLDFSTANQATQATLKPAWSGEGGERYCSQPVFDGSCKEWSNRQLTYDTAYFRAKPWSAMQIRDYNEALNKVLNGQPIIASLPGNRNIKIETQTDFEYYFGLPPCLSKDYNLGLLGRDTTLGDIGYLTPAYKCSATKKVCVDYNPICTHRKLQESWDGGPPGFLFPACTLLGVKARVIECNGVVDSDIERVEQGRYSSKKGVDIIYNALQTLLLSLLIPFPSEPKFGEGPRPSPRNFLDCTAKTCGIIDSQTPSDVRDIIPDPKLPNKLFIGVGEAPKIVNGKDVNPTNSLIRRTAEREAKDPSDGGYGQTRLSPGSPWVVSNNGNLPLRFAREIVNKCRGDQKCEDNAAKNAPRARYFPASQSPIQGY